ncbi:6,7-dimethyl-8-ribityllumazine synthase [Candidatus Acetothermia bacterium]|nr:6,7-dimethyl-8-ribityllumazine synthase [Candidatus Acetothermia bacterium]
MGQHAEGSLEAKGFKIAIVVSRFNTAITKNLLAGAERRLIQCGVAVKDLDIFWVPGSFEIPRVVKTLAETEKYDGILPLGCVIRGETPHFEYIAREVSHGLMRLALEYETPIVFGVLTTDNTEQASARAGLKSNKGAEAAESLVEVINLLKNIEK